MKKSPDIFSKNSQNSFPTPNPQSKFYPLKSTLKMSKSTPDKKALDQALEIIKNIKTLIEFGALKFDREKRQVWIVKEAFWEDKDDTWKANFCQNLKMYMDITWNADKHGPNLNPIHLYSIDIDTKTRKDYITTYLPDTKSLAVRDLQSRTTDKRDL